MKISAYQQLPQNRPLIRSTPPPPPPTNPNDKVELNSNSTVPKLAGGISGALLGALAGSQGAAGLAAVAGLGAGAATLAAAGPIRMVTATARSSTRRPTIAVSRTCR